LPLTEGCWWAPFAPKPSRRRAFSRSRTPPRPVDAPAPIAALAAQPAASAAASARDRRGRRELLQVSRGEGVESCSASGVGTRRRRRRELCGRAARSLDDVRRKRRRFGAARPRRREACLGRRDRGVPRRRGRSQQRPRACRALATGWPASGAAFWTGPPAGTRVDSAGATAAAAGAAGAAAGLRCGKCTTNGRTERFLKPN